VVHSKMLYDHLDTKDQEVFVDYEMLNLEYHQDYMLKDPKIKTKKILNTSMNSNTELV